MTDLLTDSWLESLRAGEAGDVSGVIVSARDMESIRPLSNAERRAKWAARYALSGADPAPSLFQFFDKTP